MQIELDVLVENVVKKYGSRSPLEICRKAGISVGYADMPGKIIGFLLVLDGVKTIVLNREIDKLAAQIASARLLGHSFLHSGKAFFESAENVSAHSADTADKLASYSTEKAEAVAFADILLSRPNMHQ